MFAGTSKMSFLPSDGAKFLLMRIVGALLQTLWPLHLRIPFSSKIVYMRILNLSACNFLLTDITDDNMMTG